MTGATVDPSERARALSIVKGRHKRPPYPNIKKSLKSRYRLESRDWPDHDDRGRPNSVGSDAFGHVSKGCPDDPLGRLLLDTLGVEQLSEINGEDMAGAIDAVHARLNVGD